MFENTTLLITHYNRSASLVKLLKALNDYKILFKEIIISDDSSHQEHLDAIRSVHSTYNFTLLESKTNGGLGYNLNKGIDAVKTEYLLYIQEDFYPTDLFFDRLEEAHNILKEDPNIDLVRFFSYFKLPFQRPYSDHFSTIDFHFFALNNKQFHIYSDHPHLRRKSFTDKFGTYPVGQRPDKTEYWMVIKFLQRKGKALIINDHQSLLRLNNDEEGSTYQTNYWRQSNRFFVIWLRNLYRFVKYRFNYLTMSHPYDLKD